MDELRTQTLKMILRNEIEYLCSTLDFCILKTNLIRRNILPSRIIKLIESHKVRFQEIGLFVEFLIEKPQKIYPFLQILGEECLGYKFVYDRITAEVATLTSTSLEQLVVKKKPVGQRRLFHVTYRHYLKRLLQRNEIGAFEEHRQKIVLSWQQCSDSSQKILLADRYCMAIDAEIERRIVKVDRTLVDSDIFAEIRESACYTENPILYIMLFLARYAYALCLGGKSYENVLSHMDLAQMHMANFEPCRETGVVLFILFNMRSVAYEKCPRKTEKMHLLKIAHEAIEHFSNEDEFISEDFKRQLFIKMAMLYLGLGIFGNEVKALNLCSEDIRCAKQCLKKVKERKMWERMELRWKMFYYLCRAKYLQVTDTENEYLSLKIMLANQAKAFSIQGGYFEEGKHIDIILQHLLHVQSSQL